MGVARLVAPLLGAQHYTYFVMKRTLLPIFRFAACLTIVCQVSTSVAVDLPPAPAKVLRFADIIIQRYDQNGDGVLQREEWQQMAGTPQAIDLDGDGQITRDELVWFLTHFGHSHTIHRTLPIDLREPPRFDPANLRLFSPAWQRPGAMQIHQQQNGAPQHLPEDGVEALIAANEQIVDEDVFQRLLEEGQIPSATPYHVLPVRLQGVPAWFIRLDRNGDGMVSLIEFSPALRPHEVALFRRFDRNNDGVICPNEARMGPR